MENASKALIIAGAILLSILIISLGIVIFNQASEVINNNSMSDVEKTAFNSKFTQYEGTVKGAQVNALLQAIITSNSDENNVERPVTAEGYISTTDNTQIVKRATASKTYTVTCNYTKAIVSSVTIVEGSGE